MKVKQKMEMLASLELVDRSHSSSSSSNMQSLLRSKKIQETQILVKESLLQQLSYAVKEIQLIISKKDELFSTNEECNSLIVVLEAIFLHGLKKGILKAALKTVSGENESKPTPSFWHVVSHYTHKNTIATIRKLTQVKTDVGRCRVWIRLALNEGELTSYFAAMEKDRRLLNTSYSNHAFLRDRENCDTACKLLEGILTVQFQIPINSSILNTWSSEPLMLSGIWLPPMKTPLSTGVDVAERIEDDDDDDDDDSCSIKTSSSITTLSTILALDESQALKIILETPVKKINQNVNFPPPPQPMKPECHLIEEEEEEEEVEKLKEKEKKESRIIKEKNSKEVESNGGNSLANAHGWSSIDETISDSMEEDISIPAESTEKEFKADDYRTLLEKVGISPRKKVNYEAQFQEMMQRQMEKRDSPNSASENCSRFNSYTSKLYKITREVGLKSQKYTCAGCQLSIGLTFGEAKLCYFTGEYYCGSCHLNETSVIPSRLIFNWDHKKYPVCATVHKYLSDVCNKFLIDVKTLNPKLYSAVTEMKELRALRIQLNMLKAYFYTCREPILIELQKKVSPREYIYEFIDHYSINDLCQVPGGMLASELSAITSFGRNHVINCWLCSQKGFICEICKNPKVIYPFDILLTYRCSKCFSIYHKACLSSSKNCPKCKRLRNRSLSLSENC